MNLLSSFYGKMVTISSRPRSRAAAFSPPRALMLPLIGAGVVSVVLVFSAMRVEALSSHQDKAKNPAGCAGCHKGHGNRGTAMLDAPNQNFCFKCHGSGGSSFSSRNDMQTVFLKRSHHPVTETAQWHDPAEELPEKLSSTPRHVACQDCHSSHVAEPGNTMKKVRGYKRGHTTKGNAVEEYEVCYKCHAESANLPVGKKNIADLFDPINASFHPVETTGRNVSVPSLVRPLNVASRIRCSDCHGNNDSFGPKGPHGSDYPYLLNAQLTTTQSAESPAAYQLCYQCHNRQSILADESFKSHKTHVVFQHAPCSACHTSHGSRATRHLMAFDSQFVDAVPLPNYVPANNGKPVCYLRCHISGKDVLHDMAFYQAKKWP